MKSFIESQFSYYPLIWMFHSRTLNNRINRLHERCLPLVYKDYKLTFDELLRKDKSFSIHHINLQKLATEMYKAYNDLSPKLMKLVFPQRTIHHDLRTDNPFEPFFEPYALYFMGRKLYPIGVQKYGRWFLMI